MKRLWAMTLARSLEFLRDTSALGWNLIFPLVMVAGMALIFSGPGQPLFKAAVIAPAGAALDAKLHPFLATPHVQFYAETSVEEALPKVQRHRIDMLIDLRTTPGKYWVNDQSPKGTTLERVLAGTAGPKLEREIASGAQIRYVDWVVPGVLGMNIMFSCLFGIGYVIVRYRKSGYLKRLNATPLRAIEFITAQLISRLALIMLITVVVFTGTNLFLHFRMEGSYLNLFLVALIGAISMIAMGLTVSARVTSEELAGGLLNLISSPMMVVSGVFFSMDGSPQILQAAAKIFPLTHMLEAARAVMLDGAGFMQIAPQLAILSAMAVVFLAIGASTFKWTQD
ncbi:ABC transporter permease [Stenotrophobium rhamnosiphilum]|uniref:ABC transporter permease n=1 Tax=Stenotrophobium rhamnosiphilum TaxID=2029166 RepID=A0A2T5MHY3_9GAMM|nr:ABC transporter permease [Stenotrophobium rhamnosiphilum]PTU32197.1 ABC transporter permease [Stenotrophobium rhamnosiphilum]